MFSDLDALPSENDTNGGFSGQTGEKSDFEFDNSKAIECEKLQMDVQGLKRGGLGAVDLLVFLIFFIAMNLHLVPISCTRWSRWCVTMKQLKTGIYPC